MAMATLATDGGFSDDDTEDLAIANHHSSDAAVQYDESITGNPIPEAEPPPQYLVALIVGQGNCFDLAPEDQTEESLTTYAESDSPSHGSGCGAHGGNLSLVAFQREQALESKCARLETLVKIQASFFPRSGQYR